MTLRDLISIPIQELESSIPLENEEYIEWVIYSELIMPSSPIAEFCTCVKDAFDETKTATNLLAASVISYTAEPDPQDCSTAIVRVLIK